MKTLLATSIALVLSQNVLAQTLQNGLIAHYEFEANAKDSSGNGNDGIINGNLQFGDGIFGNAAIFDGQTSFVRVPDNNSLDTDEEMSISLWVNFLSKPQDNNAFSFISKHCSSGTDCPGTNGKPEGDWLIRTGKTNNSEYVVAGFYNYPISVGNFGMYYQYPNIGEWKNIVATFKGSNFVRMYINGNLQSESNKNIISSTSKNEYKTDDIFIGAYWNGRWKYHGLIDDLRIYNRALNECEVKKLYDPVAYPDNKLNDKICENKPPIADFTVTRTDPNLRILQLDASSSTDEDGNIVKYEWLIQPDGLSATGKKPKITLPEGGVYEIVLKVTDNKGAQNIKKLTYTLDDADCQGRAKYEVSNQTLKAPYVQVLDNTNKIVWIGEALFEQVPQSETLFNLSNIKELNPPPAIGTKVCPATYKLSTKTMKLPFIDIFQNGFPNMTYSGVLKDLDKKDGKDLFVLQNLIRKQ
jgi:hypothetical protein